MPRPLLKFFRELLMRHPVNYNGVKGFLNYYTFTRISQDMFIIFNLLCNENLKIFISIHFYHFFRNVGVNQLKGHVTFLFSNVFIVRSFPKYLAAKVLKLFLPTW